MIRHTLLVIYRNLLRFKGSFIINIIGLTAGFACALLIGLWINDELGFDRFHANDERLYQVMYHEKTDQGIKTTGQTPYFLSDALKREIPEIKYAVVTTPPLFFPDFTLYCNDKLSKGTGKFVEAEFFQIFSYDLLVGDDQDVLRDKNSVVISESLARSLFNTTENVIGKPLEYEILHLRKQAFISGIFQDVPTHASERFDFILSFDIIRDLMGLHGQTYSWDFTDPFYTYVVLNDQADTNLIHAKLENFISSKSKSSPFTLFLKPFSETYLYGQYENGVQNGGRIDYVILFLIIGLFILLIACINFINLSTAKARTRLKEIAVKKVVGASRLSLVLQYLGETILLSCVALFMSLIVVHLLLPEFNLITGKSLALTLTPAWIASLVLIALATGLTAGLYPALYISGFQAARIFKGQFAGSFSELFVRKGLVVFQFTLSVIFITSVLVIYDQIRFVQSKDLGYEKDNLLYFTADGNINKKPAVFLEEVRKFHGVVRASSMFGSLTGEFNGLPGFIEYNGKKITMFQLGVNYGMLETLGVEMKLGRTFSEKLDHAADTMKWIFNEAAMEAMGESNIVGKTIADREIIGVVKNFHFQSLHEEVKPFAFRLEPSICMDIWVSVQAGKEAETIDYLRKTYAAFNPGLPFNYTFLDQAYEAQYQSEERIAVLAKYFAALAIIISCLGLYGLASFTTGRRKKEVGIRKVFGASELVIVYLLSSDFGRLVFLAVVIAMPVSYLATAGWLSGFAYRVDLQWWHFMAGGLVSFVIACVTVMGLTFRAARENPVRSLKHE